MKYLYTGFIFPLLALFVTLPQVAGAQESGANLSFVNSASLWIAVIVGVIASLLVLRNAKVIGKSMLAHVYTLFGIGMLLVVLGFVAVVVPPWAEGFVIMRTHDVLFIIGFALMAYGAGRMLKAAGLR